ncbi:MULTISPECIES: hypothetical protein [unclassified Lysinibacillus]|nr:MULTISPECIES: hypothetical protein [unclassified Lysinibacillus]
MKPWMYFGNEAIIILDLEEYNVESFQNRKHSNYVNEGGQWKM